MLLGLGEKDKLFRIFLHLFRRYNETEVIKEEKLEFELVEFRLRETPNLGISGISVKYVAEEFTGDSDPRDNKSMHVIRVDNEGPSTCLLGQPRHPIEIYQ